MEKEKRHMGLRAKNTISNTVIYIILIAMTIIWLLPFVGIVLDSFECATTMPHGYMWPKKWGFDNYVKLFTESTNIQFLHWFLNTFIMACATAILQTLIVLCMSYTLSRLRFKGRKFLMNAMLVLGMFPGMLTMIILYRVLADLGLTGATAVPGLILVYVASSGMGYYVSKGFFDTLPKSLDEAARVDGATNAQVLFKIILPLSKPIVIYTLLTAFMAPWGDFVFAKYIAAGDPNGWNVAVGLQNMIGTDASLTSNYSTFCAGGVIVAIPVAVLFMLLQRYYVEGVTGGAVKGQEKNKMAEVKLTNVKKVYQGGVVAVHDFNLTIADKEFVVFVGPSGCGKSTTLRMIAGLEEISEGTVEIDGEVVNDLQPKDRQISMVFQNYALYPHLTVFENMAFPLRLMRPRMSQDEIYARVTNAAEILGITPYLTRKPKALSGGQRQRVAIGRAMVKDCKVFLMDEPLSNLDAKLRNQMRAEIILLRKKIETTFVYVTHDQTEAMTLGDRIVIMKDGFIQQVGTPHEVFDKPVNLFVAEFIGAPKMNTFPAKLTLEGGKYYVSAFGGKLPIAGDRVDLLNQNVVVPEEGLDLTLGVRPEHIVLAKEASEDTIHVTIQVNEMMGSELHLHVLTDDGTQLVVRVPTIQLSEEERDGMVAGAELNITFEGKVMQFFDAETGVSLINA